MRFKVSVLLFLVFSFTVLNAQVKPFMEDLSYYVENLSVFELNQEEGRAFHIPETNVSLNGNWKFFYRRISSFHSGKHWFPEYGRPCLPPD